MGIISKDKFGSHLDIRNRASLAARVGAWVRRAMHGRPKEAGQGIHRC